MAIATYKTKLSLDKWAEIIGLDSRHFNQVTTAAKSVNTCDKVWKQYAWQENDQVSREDVALAIQTAESHIENHLGFRLLPSWEKEEEVKVPQPGDRTLFNVYALSPRGFPLHVPTNWKHFISGGMEKKVLIEDEVAVAYADDDADGYDETATVTVATTVTNPQEICLFHPGHDGADEYEVRPFRSISISGGTCTIKLWRHQLVYPSLLEALEPEAVDGEDDSLFSVDIDVYRRYNDPSQQVQLIWSPRPDVDECADSCMSCENSYQYGCLNAKDNRLGLVHFRPGTWNALTEKFDSAELSVCRSPDKLKMWYFSGYQDKRRPYPYLQMDPDLERAVAYYSITLLDRPICGCNNLEKVVQKWNEDLSLQISTTDSSSNFKMSDDLLNNPLGTQRGAIFAWNVVKRMGIGKAVRY